MGPSVPLLLAVVTVGPALPANPFGAMLGVTGTRCWKRSMTARRARYRGAPKTPCRTW